MSEYLKTAENVGDMSTGNVSGGDITSGQLNDIAASGVSAYKTLNSVTTEQIDISTTGQRNNSSLSDYDSIYINDFKNLLNDLYNNFIKAGLSLTDYNFFCEEYLYGKKLYEILDDDGKIKDEIVLSYCLKVFCEKNYQRLDWFDNCKTTEDVTNKLNSNYVMYEGGYAKRWEKMLQIFDVVIKDLNLNPLLQAFLECGLSLEDYDNFYNECLKGLSYNGIFNSRGELMIKVPSIPLSPRFEQAYKNNPNFSMPEIVYNRKVEKLNAAISSGKIDFSEYLDWDYSLLDDSTYLLPRIEEIMSCGRVNDFYDILKAKYMNTEGAIEETFDTFYNYYLKDKKYSDVFDKEGNLIISIEISDMNDDFSYQDVALYIRGITEKDYVGYEYLKNKYVETKSISDDREYDSEQQKKEQLETEFNNFYDVFLDGHVYYEVFDSTGKLKVNSPNTTIAAIQTIYDTAFSYIKGYNMDFLNPKYTPKYAEWEIEEIVQEECGLSAIVFKTLDGYAIDIACANKDDGGGDTTTITYPLIKSLLGDELLANYLGPMLYGGPENINADYASTHLASEVYADTIKEGTALFKKYAEKAKNENKVLDVFGYSIGGGTALSCYEALKATESELANSIRSVTVFNPFMGLLDEIGIEENEIIRSINHDEKIKIFRMDYDIASTCNNYITELNGNRVVTLVTTEQIDYDGMEDDGIDWLAKFIIEGKGHHGLIASNEAFDSNGNIINPQKTKSFNQIVSEVFGISSYEDGYDPQWFLIAIFNNIVDIQKLLAEKTGCVFDTKNIVDSLTSADFQITEFIDSLGEILKSDSGQLLIKSLLTGNGMLIEEYEEMKKAEDELNKAREELKKVEDELNNAMNTLNNTSRTDPNYQKLLDEVNAYLASHLEAEQAYQAAEQNYNNAKNKYYSINFSKDDFLGKLISDNNNAILDILTDGLVEYFQKPNNYETFMQLICFITWGYHEDAMALIIEIMPILNEKIIVPAVDLIYDVIWEKVGIYVAGGLALAHVVALFTPWLADNRAVTSLTVLAAKLALGIKEELKRLFADPDILEGLLFGTGKYMELKEDGEFNIKHFLYTLDNETDLSNYPRLNVFISLFSENPSSDPDIPDPDEFYDTARPEEEVSD